MDGQISRYTGSGYFLDLPLERSEAKITFDELFEGLWTNQHTRAVIIDFVTYNPNLNLFCICQ